ncbi:MAG: LytR C-terminal domain-containing protein [Candidatus Eisenbacteria bacterium]|uniref:LytR C-terminal domain-containing protein n=1 Tax=Eiseniibacteriota bacterium TaxID=2212470 RepID=A0A849SPA9_UNCEI|nr:LytR C-terminal domain-containing protein [Candidatus Eisenbacteria bacterium]
MAKSRLGERLARAGMVTLALVVGALVLSWAFTAFGPRTRAPVSGDHRRVVRVQVLNGSGEGGIGARVASALRQGGFHVTEVRNAERSDYFATMVVARRENVAPAKLVARYLGDLPVIRQARDADDAEVTVVIGSDRSRLHLD